MYIYIYILGTIIIPTDELIFFRGVTSTTNQSMILINRVIMISIVIWEMVAIVLTTLLDLPQIIIDQPLTTNQS